MSIAPEITALPHRATIDLNGKDARSFLQDLITNDMNQVTPTAGIYAFLLSPQGKYLHDFFIVETGPDQFLLDCPASQRDALIKRLTMFKLRSDVTLAASDRQVFASWNGDQTAAGAFDFDGTRLSDGRASGLGKRHYVEANTAPTPNNDARGYAAHCAGLGVHDPEQDFLPNKTMLMDAGVDGQFGIDWKKGCFVGQEPTARMRYRGLVKRLLIAVETPSQAALEPETAIHIEGQLEMRAVGKMQSPGFALIHRDALMDEAGAWAPQNLVSPSGATVTPRQPDWWSRSHAVAR